MKRKLKANKETFAIEKVFLDQRKVLDDGTVLVAVKWLGYDDLTFEPIQNVSEVSEDAEQKAVVADEEKKFDKRRKTLEPKKKALAKRNEKAKTQIDYMGHSLMSEEVATMQEREKSDTVEGSSLSTVAPATTRRINASRARRENISIEEQMNRSAEMRDIVAANPQTIDAVKPNLCYSSTDESSKKEDQIKPAFVPALPPPMVIMTPTPFASQHVPNTSNSTMFPYNNIFERKEKNIATKNFADNLQRHHASKDSAISKAMREENWEENSALENINDEGNQPPVGLNVCHTTLSTEMQERNYRAYGINSFFRDTQFADDVELERKLMGVAVRNLCRANNESETSAESLKRSMAQIESAGFGSALVSVQSLCASASASQNRQGCNILSSQFDYPMQTDLRCFYDQHRFTNVPIFIPLEFFSDREMVSVLSSVCFCSFSCAKSWIRERGFGSHEQGSLAHRSDSDEIMLSIFARKYFGITEEIKYAAPLLCHEDNGGTLNTKQWRALGTTHRSILRQPLCVAAPSTVISEVYVRSRKDAGKVARIVKRTEETHFNAIPERPERNSSDAAEAAKRKLKEGEGRPLKQRQTIDAQGNRITLDDEQLEKQIVAGAQKIAARTQSRMQKKQTDDQKNDSVVAKVKEKPLEPVSVKKIGFAKVATFN